MSLSREVSAAQAWKAVPECQPLFVPEGLSVSDNGRLPDECLQEVAPACRLYRDVAQSWLQLTEAAVRDGVVIRLMNRRSAYRSLRTQMRIFHERYDVAEPGNTGALCWAGQFWVQRPGMRPAAIPGTSPYGLGLAVSVAGVRQGSSEWQWLVRHAARFGWSWERKDSPWHLIHTGRPVQDMEPGAQQVPEGAAAVAQRLGGEWQPGQSVMGRLFSGLACNLAAASPERLLVIKSTREAYSPGARWAGVLKRGLDPAVAVLTDRTLNDGKLPNPVLRVASVTQAVEAGLRQVRARFSGKVFTVTGSAGKTTTTTFLARALASQGTCLASIYNNVMDGIYPAALKLAEQHFAVFETAQHSLPRSAETLSADVAILVSIAPAHMERHATLADLVRCKAGVFAGAAPGAVAVINREIPHFEMARDIAQGYGRRVVTFGKAVDADFRLLAYDSQRLCFEFSCKGRRFQARQASTGEHIALNMLAVFAAMDAAGLNWPFLLGRCAHITQAPVGRGDEHVLAVPGGTCRLINHAYNANPASMKVALAALADFPLHGAGRRVAVLSDMLELGQDSDALHAGLLDAVVAAKLDLLLLAGKQMGHLRDRCPEDLPVIGFSSVGLLFEYLRQLLRPGDVLMFKGSNGTGLNAGLQQFLKA